MNRLIFAINMATSTLVESASALATLLPAFNQEQLREEVWIHVAPMGEHKNEVGMQCVDAKACEAMVTAFNSAARKILNPLGLAFYVGHPDVLKEHRERDGRLYGRIKALDAREDGLWARTAVNSLGRAAIEDGQYEYVSPHWGMIPVPGKKHVFRPVVLRSMGLTNFPQIRGSEPIQARNEEPGHKPATNETMTPEELQRLRAQLGLAADATPDQIIAATTALNTRTTTAETGLLSARNEANLLTTRATTAEGRVATLDESLRQERTARVDLILTSAVNEGRITEAQRPEWAGKLVGAADFTKEITALNELKKAAKTVRATVGLGARRIESSPSDKSRISAINEAVAKIQRDDGLAYDAAFAKAKREHSNLFQTSEEGQE